MKQTAFILLVVIAILAGTSCESPSLQERIQQQEKQLQNSDPENIDEDFLGGLVDDYLAYANDHPEDSATPYYRFRSADILMNTGRPSDALEQLDILITRYTGFEKAADALFLKGYIYENQLGELGRAKEVYERFLEKYPDHSFADDVAVSIEHLGRSPEELVRIFEQKQEENQTENSSDK